MGLFLKHQSIKDLVDLLEENLEKLDQAHLKLAQEGLGIAIPSQARDSKEERQKKLKERLGKKIEKDRPRDQAHENTKEEIFRGYTGEDFKEEALNLEDLPYWAQGVVYQTIFERPKSRKRYRNRRR